MQHRTDIDGWQSLADLATAVGNLRYDALSEFLYLLSDKFGRDAQADDARGRPNLSSCLHKAEFYLYLASLDIDTAWLISKPHMEPNETE